MSSTSILNKSLSEDHKLRLLAHMGLLYFSIILFVSLYLMFVVPLSAWDAIDFWAILAINGGDGLHPEIAASLPEDFERKKLKHGTFVADVADALAVAGISASGTLMALGVFLPIALSFLIAYFICDSYRSLRIPVTLALLSCMPIFENHIGLYGYMDLPTAFLLGAICVLVVRLSERNEWKHLSFLLAGAISLALILVKIKFTGVVLSVFLVLNVIVIFLFRWLGIKIFAALSIGLICMLLMILSWFADPNFINFKMPGLAIFFDYTSKDLMVAVLNQQFWFAMPNQQMFFSVIASLFSNSTFSLLPMAFLLLLILRSTADNHLTASWMHLLAVLFFIEVLAFCLFTRYGQIFSVSGQDTTLSRLLLSPMLLFLISISLDIKELLIAEKRQ